MALLLVGAGPAPSQWVTRDERWPPRGSWNGALSRELPEVFRELNGIDYGHAVLAETMLRGQDPGRAQRDILEFIASKPPVAPDESQIAPTFMRAAWEVERAFDWAHAFHRSLYDLFASDAKVFPEARYREILRHYLASPDAITPHAMDHHGRLWSFPESKSFRDRYPGFNSQIWVYHWLQAAIYEVQVTGERANRRARMKRILERYHAYLKEPPLAWKFMPLMGEVAPHFARRCPEAVAIFDNLHMLHDNVDDILTRADLFPTLMAKRRAMLTILPIYLNRSHADPDRFVAYDLGGGSAPHSGHGSLDMGRRPPSTEEALGEGAPSPASAEPRHEHHHAPRGGGR